MSQSCLSLGIYFSSRVFHFPVDVVQNGILIAQENKLLFLFRKHESWLQRLFCNVWIFLLSVEFFVYVKEFVNDDIKWIFNFNGQFYRIENVYVLNGYFEMKEKCDLFI